MCKFGAKIKVHVMPNNLLTSCCIHHMLSWKALPLGSVTINYNLLFVLCQSERREELQVQRWNVTAQNIRIQGLMDATDNAADLLEQDYDLPSTFSNFTRLPLSGAPCERLDRKNAQTSHIPS